MAKLNLNSVYSGNLSRKKKKYVQDVQEDEIPIIDALNEDIPGYGHTQGKKSGEKLKRINLQFTPENHSYIQAIAKKNGTTISKFVNYIVNKQINTQDVQEATEGYKIQSKSNKRINMGFTAKNYDWLLKESTRHNISPSALLNQILDNSKN